MSPPHRESSDPIARALAMTATSPQAQALGVEIIRVEPARAWGRVHYRPDLVGDPESGVIAGGVLTTFLDQLCGMAAMAATTEPGAVATVDLRIDYMRPAIPGRDVLAEAHCYKLGKNVAFVRATAYEDAPDNPIAHAVSAFMVNSSAGREAGANLKPLRS